MKSKWKKRLLFTVGFLLIAAAVIAALFFAGGRDFGIQQFKQPLQNGMAPIVQQINGGVSQFQQKFQGGPESGVNSAVNRGPGGHQHDMSQFAQPNMGRDRDHQHSFGRDHHGWFGFGIRSLLTLAFWAGLIVLAITWLKKRRSGRIGQNVILEAPTALALHNHSNTNADFLDQWEKEQTQLKEDK